MSEFPCSIRQLHGEGVLDKVSLTTLLMRVQLSSVLNIVVIEKVLDHVERVIEGVVVRMILRSVFEKVLKGEAVLLDPGDWLV